MDFKRTYENLPFNKKRLRLKKIVKFTIYGAIISVITFCVVIFAFVAINFVSLRALADNLLKGKSDIERAVTLAKEKDYIHAKEAAESAQANLAKAKEQVRKYENSIFFGKIPVLKGQIVDAANLLEAAEVLSRAVTHGLDFVDKLTIASGHKEMRDMNKLTTEEKRAVLSFVYESAPELNGIRADIALSLMNMEKVRYRGFFRILEDRGRSFESALSEAEQRLSEAVPMAQLLPAIAGYPEKSSYLVILQNNDELRPTGGFIGTYGILETRDSDIIRLDTHDVYHMDMPVKDAWNETPPKPLKDYLNSEKWFLRDANWSPDWPTSARRIEDFYWREDALLPEKNKINNFDGKFKGVIGITPRLITDLLALVGPIKIENETYDKDNFQRLLQYRVEKGYVELGVPEWHRKEVVGQIASELKLRIMNMPAESLIKVFDIMADNLERRDIIFYFHDSGLQGIALDQDWGGEMEDPSGDYLAIIDANLASFKTDAVIKRSIDYSVSGTADPIAKLRIGYAHGGDFDWRTTKYRTYTRIYVPRGSKLVSAEGFETKVEAYEELGKTVFAGFLTVEPRSMKNVRLEYRLPAEVAKMLADGEYGFYLRKQPGVPMIDANVRLELGGEIMSYSPTGFSAYKSKDGKSITWSSEIVADQEFSLRDK